MKTAMKKRFSFIGKSLLWSLLLYISAMSVINWNEIKTAFTKADSSSYAVTPVTESKPLKVRVLQPLERQTEPAMQLLEILKAASYLFTMH